MSMLTIKASEASSSSVAGVSTASQVFQDLSVKIDKEKRSLERLHKKRQQVLERFDRDVKPIEQAFLHSRYQLLQKLVGFLARKSLSRRDRSELMDWCNALASELGQHPLGGELDLVSVTETLHQHIASNASMTPEDIEDFRCFIAMEFDVELDLDDDVIMKLLLNPVAMSVFMEDMYDRAGEYDAADDEDGWPDDEDVHDYYSAHYNAHHSAHYHDAAEEEAHGQQHRGGSSHEYSESTVTTADPSQKMINFCYKKLASRFHPDKVNSKAVEVDQHRMMVALTTAKKNRDIHTLLALYHEHIGDQAFDLPVDEIEAINRLLQGKLRQLRQEKSQLSRSEDYEGYIYRQFKGRSKKQETEHFNAYVEQLEADRDAVLAQTRELDSLRMLRSLLAERRAQFMDSFYPESWL